MTQVAERPAFELSGDDILDELGHAKDLGARDTTELIALRHRLDPATVRREVKMARALPGYTVVAAALPPTGARTDDTHETTAAAGDSPAGDDAAGAAGMAGTVPGVRIHPGQAQVIVEALQRVPRTVPAVDLAAAEAELVTAARILGPRDLRRLGTAMVAALDPDGPAPALRAVRCVGSGSVGSSPTSTPNCSRP